MSKYKQNMAPALEMHKRFWARENHERPLLQIFAPKPEAQRVPVPQTDSLAQHWLDVDFVISRMLATLQNTHYAAEALPQFWPNVGPDFFGALVGCDIELAWHTSWAKHCVDNLADYRDIRFDAGNRWWKSIETLTREAMALAQGDFFVGMTDIHSGLDAIVSLRGPENTCIDLIEQPQEVHRVLAALHDVYREVIERGAALTAAQQGTINWMGVWHPGRWYVTSCDAICLLSPAMMDEFVVPAVEAELDVLDASIFHLDGAGALKHLDRLLALPKLNGIQWVPGAGAATAAHWIDVLRRIQEAGKCIHIDAPAKEIPVLCEALRPEGVCYITHCGSAEEAEALEAVAVRASRR